MKNTIIKLASAIIVLGGISYFGCGPSEKPVSTSDSTIVSTNVDTNNIIIKVDTIKKSDSTKTK